MKNTATSKPPEQLWIELIFLFLSGGVLYYGLEIAWRGYSHWTMAFCGAICFFVIYRINEHLRFLSLPLRALLGAAAITAVEFLVGCICNLWLGWRIWDYSTLPYHIGGQICLPFSLLWFLLCFPVSLLCRLIRRRVFLSDV